VACKFQSSLHSVALLKNCYHCRHQSIKNPHRHEPVRVAPLQRHICLSTSWHTASKPSATGFEFAVQCVTVCLCNAGPVHTPRTPVTHKCRIHPQMINVSTHLIQRNDRCAHFVKNSLGRLSAWRHHCEGARNGPGAKSKAAPKVCMFIFNFVRVKNEISRSSSQMSSRARRRESSVVSPCRGFPWSTSCWSSFSQHVYPCSDQAQLQQCLKEAAHEPGEHFLQSDNGVHTTHKHTHTHANTRV
jgi:hypothetical protein